MLDQHVGLGFPALNLQLEKQNRNYVRTTIDRIENNLKERQDKMKKQLNSDKAADQNIKGILNTLELFQNNRNPWLTVGKKGKIIYEEETPVNELERKQPKSKRFQLVIFGDSNFLTFRFQGSTTVDLIFVSKIIFQTNLIQYLSVHTFTTFSDHRLILLRILWK